MKFRAIVLAVALALSGCDRTEWVDPAAVATANASYCLNNGGVRLLDMRVAVAQNRVFLDGVRCNDGAEYSSMFQYLPMEYQSVKAPEKIEAYNEN